MTDRSNSILVDWLGATGREDTATMFENGQGLFWGTNVSSITTNMAGSEADQIISFGVLPVPKLDEEQANYFNGINSYQSSVNRHSDLQCRESGSDGLSDRAARLLQR